LSIIDDKMNFFAEHNKFVLPMPTSVLALPRLQNFSKKITASVDRDVRDLVRRSGILPGTYTTIDDLRKLIDVHEELWRILDNDLSKYNTLDICKRLYRLLEIIYGSQNRNKYLNIAELALTGQSTGSEKRTVDWANISPTTEGIKFLIEQAIKNCSSKGLICKNSQFEYLINLSIRIVLLDSQLDSIYENSIPYEITISSEYDIDGEMTRDAETAKTDFMRHKKYHAIKSDKDFLSDILKGSEKEVTPDDFLAFKECKKLDDAMQSELGYGLTDWLKYVKGCMCSFKEKDFIKSIGVNNLSGYLNKTVGLTQEKIQLLLMDHALSKATVKRLTHNDMMPISKIHRDSRLLRRPLLDIDDAKARVAIIGIETFENGTKAFWNAVEYGSLNIPRMTQKGPIRLALGNFQSQIGAPLRDELASECNKMGFIAKIEWPIPQYNVSDPPLGPIDILVIDSKMKRFILVETKNINGEGIYPLEIKSQRERFLGSDSNDTRAYVPLLSKKVSSFNLNIKTHLHNLKMEEMDDYAVEGVIVVGHPLFWLLFAYPSLPIFDDLEFLKRLRSGSNFSIISNKM
jgi:hypothetical protein